MHWAWLKIKSRCQVSCQSSRASTEQDHSIIVRITVKARCSHAMWLGWGHWKTPLGPAVLVSNPTGNIHPRVLLKPNNPEGPCLQLPWGHCTPGGVPQVRGSREGSLGFKRFCETLDSASPASWGPFSCFQGLHWDSSPPSPIRPVLRARDDTVIHPGV